MGNITQIVLLGFLIIGFFGIWVTTGGFIAQANNDLKDYRGSGNDEDLHDASWYTFWATFITWFIVSLIVVLAVIGIPLLIIGGIFFAPELLGAEAVESTLSTLGPHQSLISKIIKIGFWIVLLITMGFCILNGILAFLALSSMTSSPEWSYSDDNLAEARKDILITGLTSIGAVIAIVTFFASYLLAKVIKKHNKTVK